MFQLNLSAYRRYGVGIKVRGELSTDHKARTHVFQHVEETHVVHEFFVLSFLLT